MGFSFTKPILCAMAKVGVAPVVFPICRSDVLKFDALLWSLCTLQFAVTLAKESTQSFFAYLLIVPIIIEGGIHSEVM